MPQIQDYRFQIQGGTNSRGVGIFFDPVEVDHSGSHREVLPVKFNGHSTLRPRGYLCESLITLLLIWQQASR